MTPDELAQRVASGDVEPWMLDEIEAALRRLGRLEHVLMDLGRQGYMTGGIERELLELAREATHDA